MRTRHYVALALLWTVGVLLALFLPISGAQTVALSWADKAVHAVLFAGLGIFWMRATRRPLWGIQPPSLPVRGLLVAMGCGVFAVLTEIGQSVLLTSRRGEPLDAVADLVGLALAVGAYLLRGEPDDQERELQEDASRNRYSSSSNRRR